MRTSEQKIYTPSITTTGKSPSLTEKLEIDNVDTQESDDYKSLLRYDTDYASPLSSKFTDRDLPPLPVNATPRPPTPRTPVRIALYDPPVPEATSPLPSPARSNISQTSSPVSRSQSPSIRNLDQMSVVKQRLAQIQQSSSPLNSPDVLREKSTRRRQIVRVLPDSPNVVSGTRSILLRHGTITTVGAGSTLTIDAYDGFEELRRSTLSRRLTSIPSGESIGTAGSTGVKGAMLSTSEPRQGSSISSPASRYSHDSAAIEIASAPPPPPPPPPAPAPSPPPPPTPSPSTPTPSAASAHLVIIDQRSSDSAEVARPKEREDVERPASRMSENNKEESQTARSTRSLSIFSPCSRYSEDAVAREQATGALKQLLDVERIMSTIPPASNPPSAQSTPMASPQDTVCSAQSKLLSPHSSAADPEPPQKAGICTPTLLAYLNSAPTPATVHWISAAKTSSEPPKHVPSEQAELPRSDTCGRADTLVQVARQVVGHAPPEPAPSACPQRRKDAGNIHTHMSEPSATAALFSRFANLGGVLPTISIITDPPPPREAKPKPSLPPVDRDCVSHDEGQKKLADVEKKLSSVQTDLSKLPADLSAAVAKHSTTHPAVVAAAVQPPDVETKYLLADIDDAVRRIEDQGERNALGLNGIHAKVDALMSLKNSEAAPSGTTLAAAAGLPPPISGLPSPHGSSPLAAVDASVIMSKLEEMRSELKSDLPMLARKLEGMLKERAAEGAAAAAAASTVRDLAAGPEVLADTRDVPPGVGEQHQDHRDDALHDKLDRMLLAIQTKSVTQEVDEKPADPDPEESNAMVSAHQHGAIAS